MASTACNIPMMVIYTAFVERKAFVVRTTSAGLLLALIVFSTSWSQENQDSLVLWLDCACFQMMAAAGPETLTTLEIYYGLNQKELATDSPQGPQQIAFTLEVHSLSESLITKDEWRMVYRPARRGSEQTSQILSDLYQTRLAPGEYKLVLAGQDLRTSKVGWQQVFITVPSFSSSNLTLSDIQLALQISETGEQTKFTKNSRLVVPNPTTVYGSLYPLLYFYAEAYNLGAGGTDTLYTLTYDILDSGGAMFKEYGQYTKVKPGNSAVIATGLNLATLPMGKYHLQVTVSEPSTGRSAQARKVFFVYREEEVGGSAEPMVTEPKDEEEAQKIRNIITYIATPDDLRLYDGLILEGKRGFLKDFWKSKDPDLTTPTNEYKMELYRRFAFASQKFATGTVRSSEGWKSDRGRIYIVYGPPDDVAEYPYSPDRKPWDKWIYYNVQGGVVFLFEDQNGYGDYLLVHSTAQGEKRDPKWQKYQDEEVFTPNE